MGLKHEGEAMSKTGVAASSMSCFDRVLVLYLGNLYSLIIALLDKVDSMSIAVSDFGILTLLQTNPVIWLEGQ